MLLEGSCHCRSVTFRVRSATPYPYRVCYCERCRKTQGGAGAAVYMMAEEDGFEVTGAEHLSVYTAHENPPGPRQPPMTIEFSFCRHCGSHLFAKTPAAAGSVYPLASAIDTPLPTPPEVFHIHHAEKPDWVSVPAGPGHVTFDELPEESIHDWHERHGLS